MKSRILHCASAIVLSACFFAGGTLAAGHAQATQSSSSAPASHSKHKSKWMKKSTSSTSNAAAPANAAPSKPAGSATAATSKPATTPAATASSSHGPKMTAQTPPQPGMVWVNTDSKVYHKAGSAYYGKTKQGKWMTEQEATKAGYRAAKN